MQAALSKEMQNSEYSSAEYTIRLLYGRDKKTLKEMLENIGIYAVMSYVESKKIVIPNIGALSIKKEGSNIQYNFIPSPFLIRSIGQIKNKDDSEVEGMLARRYKHLIQADSKPRKNDTSKKKRPGQEQAAQF